MHNNDKIKEIGWREIFDKIPDLEIKGAFFKQKSVLLLKFSNSNLSLNKFIKILVKAYSTNDRLIDLKRIDALIENSKSHSEIQLKKRLNNKTKAIAWREIFDKIPDFEVKGAFFKQKSDLLLKFSNSNLSLSKFIKILVKAYSTKDGLIDLKRIDALIENSEILVSDSEIYSGESFMDSKKALVLAMQTFNPVNFAYQLLAQKGRQLNKHQKYIISKFRNTKKENIRLYRDEMINLATYTCIEIYDSLNSILFKTLLDDWQKNKIINCNAGLNYVENHKRGYNNFSEKRIEQGTDWKKKLANKPTSNTDDGELEKIMENLKKFDPKY